jgi:hypothetical protein
MTAEALAAWVQAVGSILAIGAGFLTMYLQNRHADEAQEAERARRAEVVAYRLSGWVAETGVRIEALLSTCQEQRRKASQGPPRIEAELIHEVRLRLVSQAAPVLPELHYLRLGSGDIAQLNFLAQEYDGWLDHRYERASQPGRGVPLMTEASIR